MKKFILFIFICLFCFLIMPVSFAGNKLNEVSDQSILPFSEVIDWHNKEQRKDYEKFIGMNYTIGAEKVRIRYQYGSGDEVKNPWCEEEYLNVIFDNNSDAIGYIWTIKNLTVPIVIFRKKSDNSSTLVYTKVWKIEAIHDIKRSKSIMLVSSDVVSVGWFMKKMAGLAGYELEKRRDIVKDELGEECFYSDSTRMILDLAKKHHSQVWNLWCKDSGIIFLSVEDIRSVYNSVKEVIKKDIQNSGADWQKRWKDIKKKWSSMKSVS